VEAASACFLRYEAEHYATLRVRLVEKTDRLYRNLKDCVTDDEPDLEIHLKEMSLFCRIPDHPRNSCTELKF
jgi:hypothetical protein